MLHLLAATRLCKEELVEYTWVKKPDVDSLVGYLAAYRAHDLDGDLFEYAGARAATVDPSAAGFALSAARSCRFR